MESTSLIHFPSAPPSDFACKVCETAESSRGGVELHHLIESGDSGCQECHLRYIGVIQALSNDPSWGSANICVDSRGSLSTLFTHENHRYHGTLYFYTRFGEARSAWPTVGFGRTASARRTIYAAIIQAWLQACDESHTECRKSRDDWYEPQAELPEPRDAKLPELPKLPTRVLDVEPTEPDVIKVIEVADEKGSYIALSHCWGGDIEIRTTRDNFRARPTDRTPQRDIPFHDLPKNFQDAVAVTRAAGLRYLWIDALCILQNDKEDWEKESGSMAAVYKNAHFVLGADMSPDSHGGFLDTEECGYKRREIPVATFGAEKSTIYARCQYNLHDNPCSMFDHYKGGQDRSPLQGRAWTLQEQLLASRMVHFTEKEMIWECKTALWCACGELDMGISAQSERLLYYESLTSESPDKFVTWYRVVDDIGRRKITKQADLLPALSGLAQQFQSYGAGTYLAGIWQNDLPQGLLWTSFSYPKSKKTRADPYRAPSWSWASIGNGVGRYGPPSGRLERVYAEIRDAKCVPDGKDPLGAVAKDQCYLKVYGPLMELVHQGSGRWDTPGQWADTDNASQIRPPWLPHWMKLPHRIRLRGPIKPTNYYDFDFDLDWDPKGRLYYLYIGDLALGSETEGCKGLILRPYKNSPHPEFEKAFERVGSFDHSVGTVEKYAQFIEMREVVIF